MRNQPVPNVTANDVERIVRRDYPGTQCGSVLAVLKSYAESPSGRRELLRVQLAALKLANGDLSKLRTYISTAIQDFRDVVGPAEYPEYSLKIAFRTRKPTVVEVQRIIENDWKQYEDWLNR